MVQNTNNNNFVITICSDNFVKAVLTVMALDFAVEGESCDTALLATVPYGKGYPQTP
jgi:hypothetical protein